MNGRNGSQYFPFKTLINRFWHEQLASVPQRLRFAYPSGEFEKWHPQ